MIDEVSIQFSKCTTGMHGDDGLWKWCMVVRVVCDGGNGAHFCVDTFSLGNVCPSTDCRFDLIVATPFTHNRSKRRRR